MALNNTQDRVEKSIFKVIERVLIDEGYWPDGSLYPNDQAGNDGFDAAIDAITLAKGFAIQPYGHSSSHKKGMKSVPRMVIISRKVLPGEIGSPMQSYSYEDPLNPNNTIEAVRPMENLDIHMDIHLVSGNNDVATQDRIMNAVMAKAIGSGKAYIPAYDNGDLFFIRQYNYYDLPDPQQGLEEKVYSYEIKDLYLSDDTVVNANASRIKDILMELGWQDDLQTERIIGNSNGLFYASFTSQFIDSPYLPKNNFPILGVKIEDILYPINQLYADKAAFLSFLQTDFLLDNASTLPSDATISYDPPSKYFFLTSDFGTVRLEIMAIYQTFIWYVVMGTLPIDEVITDQNILDQIITVDNDDNITLDQLKDCKILDIHMTRSFLTPNQYGYTSHDPEDGVILFPGQQSDSLFIIKTQQIPSDI